MNGLNSDIEGMRKKGMNNSKIIEELKNKGHSSQEIYEALDKGTYFSQEELEAPSPDDEEMETSSTITPLEKEVEEKELSPSLIHQQIPQRQIIEQIEEVAEAIVDERMQEFSSLIGDLNIWKERADSEISATKQELIRVRNQLENLQITIIGKVEGYNKSISTLSSEMKALSKVMEKIMSPLTTNVKELSRITEKFKKIK